METLHEIYRRIFGKYYIENGITHREPRSHTKHGASKRGHQHNHRPSRGQRNHAAFVKDLS